jgi:hypothetical protein
LRWEETIRPGGGTISFQGRSTPSWNLLLGIVMGAASVVCSVQSIAQGRKDATGLLCGLGFLVAGGFHLRRRGASGGRVLVDTDRVRIEPATMFRGPTEISTEAIDYVTSDTEEVRVGPHGSREVRREYRTYVVQLDGRHIPVGRFRDTEPAQFVAQRLHMLVERACASRGRALAPIPVAPPKPYR